MQYSYIVINTLLLNWFHNQTKSNISPSCFCGTLHLLDICILFPRYLILKIIGKRSAVNSNLILSFVHYNVEATLSLEKANTAKDIFQLKSNDNNNRNELYCIALVS